MTFDLFGIDFYRKEELFGFWLGSIKSSHIELHRSLLSIYWNDGNFTVDLFWFRVVDAYPIDWVIGLK